MSMIKLTNRGDFGATFKYLKFLRSGKYLDVLDKYGQKGVDALSSATPVDTGKTAASWSYQIEDAGKGRLTITWKNTNLTKEGIPVVVLIFYGHSTRRGGYVQGRDFINPAIAPIFDEIAEAAWKEVTQA